MNDFSSVMFNGIEQDEVVLNGETVWRRNNNEPIDFEPYTVGLLSDVHISTESTDDTKSQTDFARAINYYNSANPKMVLIAGDLTVEGKDGEFAKYNELKNSSNVPFFETTGNHEASSGRTYKSSIKDGNCIAYKFYDLIGKDFCYCLKDNKYYGWKLSLNADGTIHSEVRESQLAFTIPEKDVYIFVGILGDANNNLFFQEELQWLKDTLEENRNNRCFVIEHCRADRLRWDSSQGKYVEDRYADYVSGNYGSKYIKALWGQADNSSDGKYARCFEELMSHYTNCIWLHGHSHMSAKTGVNHGVKPYLYDTHFGNEYSVSNFNASVSNTRYSYSVHISSCAEPREEIGVNSEGSEGCLMVVNQDSITIKYIDFTTNEILIEYTIPTSRNTVAANSFADPTGLVI